MKKQTSKARHQMVETIRRYQRSTTLIDSNCEISERILSAFLEVPREIFVPEDEQHLAYEDTPLPIGAEQTISQPYIVALMTALLEVHPGEKVLDIGTGSGYQAAILAALGLNVYSIEIQQELYDRVTYIYQTEYVKPNVHLRYGDGFWGWPEAAPFDGILIAATMQEISQHLLAQLKVGGKMVVPLAKQDRGQILCQIVKKDETTHEIKEIMPVRFVPFTRKRD